MIFSGFFWSVWLLGGCFLGDVKAERFMSEKFMDMALSSPNAFPDSSAESLDKKEDLAKSRLYHNMRFFDNKGKAFTLRSLDKKQGKPTLVILWAPWCSPCLREFPSVEHLNQVIGDVVRVVPISIEPPAEGRTEFSVEDFSVNKKFFDILTRQGTLPLFYSLEASQFMGLEKINAIPTALLYDETGHLVRVMEGARDWSLKENRHMLGDALGISEKIKRAERLWQKRMEEIKKVQK